MGTTNTDSQDIQSLYRSLNEAVSRKSAAGSFYGQYERVLSGINKHGAMHLPNNKEISGFVFITRPELNFSTTSLKQDRILSMLNTLDPSSMAFAVRCLLDTKFCKNHLEAAESCRLIDQRSPFILPLTNCLTGISGWPDYILDTETTEGGFFSEDLTFAKGSDELNKTYELTLTFRDLQGGVILSLLYLWIRTIGLMTKGRLMPYPDFIRHNRLCYTSSIYCFTLDPSLHCISKWAKATGCFPVSSPIGSVFNFNEGENTILASQNLSIPFTTNHISYMDPMILHEFNMITERFHPELANIGKTDRTSSLMEVSRIADFNYIGLPHIDLVNGINELKFYDIAYALEDPISNALQGLKDARLESEKQLLETDYFDYGGVSSTDVIV